jgi:hypothetical protein
MVMETNVFGGNSSDINADRDTGKKYKQITPHNKSGVHAHVLIAHGKLKGTEEAKTGLLKIQEETSVSCPAHGRMT